MKCVGWNGKEKSVGRYPTMGCNRKCFAAGIGNPSSLWHKGGFGNDLILAVTGESDSVEKRFSPSCVPCHTP